MAKCLAWMTDETTKNNLIKDLGPSIESRVTLIQFADDTFFLSEAKKKYMWSLKFLWKLFEWASGLKANEGKSKLYYTGQTNGRVIRLANILEYKIGNLLTNYLGLCLSNKSLKRMSENEYLRKYKEKLIGGRPNFYQVAGDLYLWMLF